MGEPHRPARLPPTGRGVGIGFGFASLVGIPLGLFIGANRRAWMAINPIVQMLRPVSPLAWVPIWLVVFRDNGQAAILVIFMTADKIVVLGNPPGPSVVSVMDVALPRPRIELEGAEGVAHRAAQQQLLGSLEIPAA